MKRPKNLQVFTPKMRPCIEQKIMCTVEKDQAKKFLNGKKRWHYAYDYPRHERSEVLLCEQERGVVLGRVLLIAAFADNPEVVWNLTGRESGMSLREFKERFLNRRRIYALNVAEPRAFGTLLPASKYGMEELPEKLCDTEL